MIIILYYKPMLTVFIHYRSVYLISNDLNSIMLVLTLFESCLVVNEIRILSLVVGLLLLKDSFELCSISRSLYLSALTQLMVYPLRRSIQNPANCQLVQRNIPRNAQFIHTGRSGLSIFVLMIN